MAEAKIKLPIRSALIPVFYQNFHCLMHDCRDNCCCAGWVISFDKKDYLRLRRLDAPPALKELLGKTVRRVKKDYQKGMQYAQFDLDSNDGRCPFLNGEGLCGIQRACGHEVLPFVCKNYPRKANYSISAKEYSLSPSCEGVLQQLWDLPDGVEFVEDPLPEAEWCNTNVPPGDNLWVYYALVREMFIDVLQNRAMPLTKRLLYLGIMIQRLQEEDWTAFDPDRWAKQAALLAESDALRKINIPKSRIAYLALNVGALGMIDPFEKKEEWTSDIYEALGVNRNIIAGAKENGVADNSTNLTLNFSGAAYADALARFQAAFSDYEYFFENLMVATALFLNFPDFPNLGSKEALWESYVLLCSLYSFFRFVSVAGCKGEATKERLFHMIVMACRSLIHSPTRLKDLRKLFQRNSPSLEHIAVLLHWN